MPASSITEDQITMGGRTVRYTVRRSERARRMRLRVLPGGGVEVVLPRGFTLREAATFVRREWRWVLRALDRVQPAAPAALGDGASLPYLGRTLRDGDVLALALTAGTPVAAAVESWYRAEARRVIAARAAARAAALGVTHGRITIKDTRSRWGSCSSKGNLNFSWRLLLAPAEVLDYVVAHEVAHLRELNHSPRFWALVASLCPDYRTPRAWLRAHGHELAAWPWASDEC
jgi:predicted metal-dependent hydrolase